MRKANDIIELYKNLTPGPLDKSASEFYIEVYQEQIEKIRFSLLTNEDHTQTIYVAGQSGTGKTTALNFLPDSSIEENFEAYPNV